ncbi:MAG: transglycosylase domain-containing protein, partial [Clostridia bacterium]
MEPEKRTVPRRKVNKRTFRKKASGKDVAKGFWVSFKIVLKTVFMLIIIAGCIAGGLLMGVVAGCIITTEPITEEQLDIKNTTALTSFVYDVQGNELVHIKGTANQNRQLISIEEVPDYFAKAFVAIEDERFYTHKGVDVKRSIAAFLGYVIPGMDSHGGSTITQQVIKNITGDDAQSVPRKIREQWRAMNLEKELDKEEILELYMNVIYMGQDLYGVKSAALAY